MREKQGIGVFVALSFQEKKIQKKTCVIFLMCKNTESYQYSSCERVSKTDSIVPAVVAIANEYQLFCWLVLLRYCFHVKSQVQDFSDK